MMISLKENPQMIYFLFGCIPSRILLIIIAKFIADKKVTLPLMGFISLIISFVFAFLYMFNLRQGKQLETFGKDLWWNSVRPIHSALYLLFALYAIKGQQDIAWVFLLLDLLVAITAFVIHYFL